MKFLCARFFCVICPSKKQTWTEVLFFTQYVLHILLYIMELQMFIVVKNIENSNRKKLNLNKFQILWTQDLSYFKKQDKTRKFCWYFNFVGKLFHVTTIENINYQKYSLVFQTQISKSQDDDIRILFCPILTQIVYIRLLNFRGQFLIAWTPLRERIVKQAGESLKLLGCFECFSVPLWTIILQFLPTRGK